MAAKKAKRGPGQPPKGRKALTTNFVFKVSEELLERLEAAARKAGQPARTLVRRIVATWLRKRWKLED